MCGTFLFIHIYLAYTVDSVYLLNSVSSLAIVQERRCMNQLPEKLSSVQLFF